MDSYPNEYICKTTLKPKAQEHGRRVGGKILKAKGLRNRCELVFPSDQKLCPCILTSIAAQM